jgi:putative membrane protein
MKTLLKVMTIGFAFTLALASCGKKNSSDTDSKEVAKDQNEEKFDSTNIEKDTDFVVAAADGGMLEVQLGQLAEANASTAEVKKFGQSMVDDHSKANDELKALAASKNISIPAVLSDKHQKKYDELAKKTGIDFDKDYIDFMVKDHKEDIDDFKKEADKGNDAEIKSWAAGKVATLEHHLMMAENAQKTVKDKK